MSWQHHLRVLRIREPLRILLILCFIHPLYCVDDAFICTIHIPSFQLHLTMVGSSHSFISSLNFIVFLCHTFWNLHGTPIAIEVSSVFVHSLRRYYSQFQTFLMLVCYFVLDKKTCQNTLLSVDFQIQCLGLFCLNTQDFNPERFRILLNLDPFSHFSGSFSAVFF